MKLHKFLFIAFFIFYNSLGSLGPFIPEKGIQPQNVLANSIQNQLKGLEDDKKNLINKEQISKRLDLISSQIISVKDKLRFAVGTQQDFLQKKLSILNQQYQTSIELEQSLNQVLSVIDEHTKLLNEYKEDPEFKKFKIPAKAYYLFNEELQELAKKRFEHEEKITNFEEKKQNILVDLNNRKKAQSILIQEYKEKRRQQEEFATKSSRYASYETQGFSLREQGELLDDQEKLLSFKKELTDMRVKETELKEVFIKFQLDLTTQQFEVINNEYERIKRLIRIDDNFLTQALNALERKRQESLAIQERNQEKIRVLLTIKEGLKKQINIAIKRCNVPQTDVPLISEWTKETSTLANWISLCSIGNITNHDALLETQKEHLDANINLEKLKFVQEEISFKILKSWQKMTSGSFDLTADSGIDAEIKSYNSPKSDLQAEINLITDKRNSATQALHNLNNILENLKTKIKKIKEQKDIIFRDHLSEFTECLALLNDAEELLRLRIDSTTKLIEVYSASISIMNNSVNKIDQIVTELSSKSFWRSSNEALLNRIYNFFPDLKVFFGDIFTNTANYLKTNKFEQAKNWFYFYFTHPLQVLLLIILLICTICFFIVIKRYNSKIKQSLLAFAQKGKYAKAIAHLLIYLIDFINLHYDSLIVWSILFVTIGIAGIVDKLLQAWFYLFSIFYLLFIAFNLINYFIGINEAHGYAFVSEHYQKRLKLVASCFIYSTIFILLLRQAFLQANYHSDVPTVLLAINFIILQVALIGLIGREQILAIVPTTTPMWQWVHDHVKKYYYLIVAGLIIVIIISNPYVGWGRQVLYVLLRIFLTALLFPLFSFVHQNLKKGSQDLFFYSDGEIVKERFVSGKTWYGIFVISTFIFFAIFCFMIGAVIWGQSITFHDMNVWIHKELPIIGYDAAGKRMEVTPFSFFKIFLFVICGMLIAYIVNRFILRKIFNLLLVGTGMQSMLLTLTRYFIVIMAFLIGIQNVGLSSTLWYIAALIGGIAFAMKEPVSDVISYFIILVQRPIKIGDFIHLDEEINGVVRYITPRSVMLRKKNSVTIVVPNSHFITKPVINWNLTRSFFAFNDIMLIIPYSHDPELVKKLILQVLHNNVNLLKNPSPIVYLWDFLDHGFRFLIRGFLSSDRVLDQWEISSEIRIEIIKTLRKHNIEIAEPVRLVKLVSGSFKQD
ncbi:mechanosensitive ion channel [Candidatus Dependentiae bacterium]|nr:mechanosensitive ion channel [Candidatus Dependentiae bacterium]